MAANTTNPLTIRSKDFNRRKEHGGRTKIKKVYLLSRLACEDFKHSLPGKWEKKGCKERGVGERTLGERMMSTKTGAFEASDLEWPQSEDFRTEAKPVHSHLRRLIQIKAVLTESKVTQHSIAHQKPIRTYFQHGTH